MLAHNVYFTLKDNSAAARQQLLAACNKYLSSTPARCSSPPGSWPRPLKREVNDRDFDVGLHVIFADQSRPRPLPGRPAHHQFIAENKDNWKKVRVFDSVVEARESKAAAAGACRGIRNKAGLQRRRK